MARYSAQEANEIVITQRAALIAIRLYAGEILTTDKLSSDYNIHRSTAYRTLSTLSQLSEFPLIEENGNWYLIDRVALGATTT